LVVVHIIGFLGNGSVLKVRHCGFVKSTGAVDAQLRYGDRSQNPDNGDNNQEFDKREAFVIP
jgi:hypothetical protein